MYVVNTPFANSISNGDMVKPSVTLLPQKLSHDQHVTLITTLKPIILLSETWLEINNRSDQSL